MEWAPLFAFAYFCVAGFTGGIINASLRGEDGTLSVPGGMFWPVSWVVGAVVLCFGLGRIAVRVALRLR